MEDERSLVPLATVCTVGHHFKPVATVLNQVMMRSETGSLSCVGKISSRVRGSGSLAKQLIKKMPSSGGLLVENCMCDNDEQRISSL